MQDSYIMEDEMGLKLETKTMSFQGFQPLLFSNSVLQTLLCHLFQMKPVLVSFIVGYLNIIF
jgi:hypothetical protein